MTCKVKESGFRSTAIWRLWAVVLLATFMGVAGSGVALAQDAADQEAVAADAPADAPADVADDVAADAQPESEGDSLEGFAMLALVIAVFIVPLFLGNRFAKSLKMPDHGWKFALAIGTLSAAAVVVYDGEVKFGPDLSGGITLIYELQDTSLQKGGEEDSANGSNQNQKTIVDQLIIALAKRVDPSGTKEVTIRKYGAGQIEIIIPEASEQEEEYIKRRISTAGALEFRITASQNFLRHRAIIEQAQQLSLGENELWQGESKVAEWVPYSIEEFGPVDSEDSRLVKRLAGTLPQALVLTNDGLDVTGEDLSNARASFGRSGTPEVQFSFNAQGAFKFGQLTGTHLPTPADQKYQLGILLDKKLLSAPSINSKITSSGVIEGIPSKEEVDFLVGILNAGHLPASLNKDPISSHRISPTLGAETVRQGRTAILISLAAVMVFMAFYYRFAGLVACLALAANLLLILGLMVLFKAAFTLPGLAGLVLTIGMSVDANVLIFERIREERARGAALRMAILNGFARATRTIVDANVTTLITAIVIYKIAPDNVKGFGVTLILGIVMSMYSAIFLSRLVFDVCERTRRLKELSMAQIIGSTQIDFLSKVAVALIVSLVLIGIGLVSVYNRGGDMLNIDFTGGSSVTIVFKQDQTMSYAEVKDLLEQTELKEMNLSLVAVGDKGNRYTVRSVEQDVGAVQQLLHDIFGEHLETYHVQLNDIRALPAQTDSGTEGDDQTSTARTDPFAGGTSAQLDFSLAEDLDEDGGVSYETVTQLVQDALDDKGHSGAASDLSHPEYQPGSARRFSQWEVRVALPEDQAREVLIRLQEMTNNSPMLPLANKIGGRVAGDMRTKAIAAVAISLIGIVAYIWFRFQRVIYGFAAVVALVHDVLITLGIIGLSSFFVENIPALASTLLVEKFQISLTIVAALLTIIGYSLNDTIVVFDRIREVKGKSPNLTAELINTSI
ncbi:MAG: protein translocase subunit SecD, partial [Planctomycetes bacterium]|nr:protein translocase subunit SecD [Planctomycetota bacterium]